MVKKVRHHKDAMGQTGEGISSRDQIDMSLDNAFTNKWGQYSITYTKFDIIYLPVASHQLLSKLTAPTFLNFEP
jgi:hypothetical protein